MVTLNFFEFEQAILIIEYGGYTLNSFSMSQWRIKFSWNVYQEAPNFHYYFTNTTASENNKKPEVQKEGGIERDQWHEMG